MNEKMIKIDVKILWTTLKSVQKLIELDDSLTDSEMRWYWDTIIKLYTFLSSSVFLPMVSIYEDVNILNSAVMISVDELYSCIYKGYKSVSRFNIYEKRFIEILINYENTGEYIDLMPNFFTDQYLKNLIDTCESRTKNMIGESYIKGYRAALLRIRKDLHLDS